MKKRWFALFVKGQSAILSLSVRIPDGTSEPHVCAFWIQPLAVQASFRLGVDAALPRGGAV